MKIRSLLLVAAVVSVFTGCNPPSASNNTASTNANASNANTTLSVKPDQAKKSAPTDLKALAARIVNQSAGVKEGDVVMIDGGARDQELIEDLAVEVAKAGGQPLVLFSSDSMAKRLVTEVPEKYDTAEPKVGMALAKAVNVSIAIDSNETEGLLADVPPARMEARAKAGAPVAKEFIKNKIRSVAIGNDLYPTEWRAKRFDMPIDNFAKMFWEGVNIDYTSLQDTAKKAQTALAGKEIEITNPNGTSLKATLQSKPAYLSDGVISADDVAKGNLDVFLPAGEAAVITAPNSGEGRFVIDKDYFQGKEVHNVVMTFQGGKLVNFTGEGEGFAAMKADYDARGAGKDLLSYIDIGINTNFALTSASKVGNWVSAGMVSLGTGNNTWAGGTNEATSGFGGHLTGCTVKVDGKTVVENGSLKL